jgi:tetrahydromethanopterin S-methyltransferase subunit G
MVDIIALLYGIAIGFILAIIFFRVKGGSYKNVQEKKND